MPGAPLAMVRGGSFIILDGCGAAGAGEIALSARIAAVAGAGLPPPAAAALRPPPRAEKRRRSRLRASFSPLLLTLLQAFSIRG